MMRLNKTIDIEQIGSRLDTIISYLVPSCSRSQAAKLISTGEVRVNGGTKKPGYRVKSGDQITGMIPDGKTQQLIRSQQIEIDICFEDDHIIVVDKKPGMVVHPAAGNLTDTLVNALLHHYPDIKNTCRDLFRSGIVHRLDKDTSGLMVVAKTEQALNFLQKEFKHRRVEKKYQALVHGHLADLGGRIDLPIGRHPVKRKIMAVLPDTGKRALTLWSVKKQLKADSLVEVFLKTGRTHQIRVHFYAMDHPLIGDRVYQHRRFRKKSIAPRQMLHSFFLGFRHPYTGKRFEIKSDLPADFISIISQLE